MRLLTHKIGIIRGELIQHQLQIFRFSALQKIVHIILKAVKQDNVIFRTFNLMDPIRFRLKFDVSII